MGKFFSAVVAIVLVMGLTAPAGAFQWLIEMEPGEVINFHTPYGADYRTVEVTNVNLMRALMECPKIETPQQASFYFMWLFNIMGCAEPPAQYPNESLQDYADRLAAHFRAAVWSGTLVRPVVVKCDDCYCTLTNNTEATVSFPYNCLLPLLEE